MPVSDSEIVVASYGPERLTLDNFEYQYARSTGGREIAEKDSLSEYQDFLDRYVNFKLKVLEARKAGLEKDSTIQSEIANYREQLARPFLLDQKVKEPLLKDLYEKRKEVIDASHILFRLDLKASPEDTLAAYTRLAAIRDSIRLGANFGDMAVRYSEDPSAKGEGLGARGRLGYFSAGKMVKPFEDWAYRTPVGAVSPIFRTQFGYHILYVHDRKPKPSDIEIAHIMIRPGGTTPADTALALARVDSVLTRLAGGEDFADVARTASDDKSSAKGGGTLGKIAYDSRLLASLKDASFGLKEVGDISEPVLTQFGYHIIKLIGRSEDKSFEDSRDDLGQMIARLPRAKKAQEAYAVQIRAQRRTTVDSTALLHAFNSTTVDSVFQMLDQGKIADSLRTLPIASIGDSTYTVGEFLRYSVDHPVIRKPDVAQQVFDTVDEFLNDRAIDYEVQALEDRDADFRATMAEFRDGLLLFRLMQDSVWTPASKDSVALRAYFDAHPGAYRFGDRERIIGIFSRSDAMINKLAQQLESGSSMNSVINVALTDSLSQFRVDTTLVSEKTDSIFDQAVALPTGGHTSVIPYNKGFLILFNGGSVPAREKTYEEAKAEVINVYQKILEERLLTRLRAEFNARTYPERLAGAFRRTTNNSTGSVSSLH